MSISAASLALRIADFRSQALNWIIGSSADFGSVFMSALADSVPDSNSAANAVVSPGASSSSAPAGHNMSLFDPESAFDMMSVINNDDVSYKAQFAELDQMKASMAQLQDTAQNLASITASTGNDSAKARLQDFVGQYDDWVRRFDPDMQQGGLLADTQAAQVSRYELDQSVENVFNGAGDGLHGLRDLGIAIDPNTKLASFDTNQFDSVLATNKTGVMDTLQEFSANFARSAGLLNANGNFVSNQLDNLGRAIHYIDGNLASWQTEFGTGNAAAPSRDVAQALAAYNKNYGA